MSPRFTKCILLHACILLCVVSVGLHAQLYTDKGVAGGDFERPTETDPYALKVIQNYLRATGGLEAHRNLEVVRATGTLTGREFDTRYKYLETRSGKRLLRRTWRELGTVYETVMATNGEIVWTQNIKPELTPPQIVKDENALHFKRHPVFLYPFTDLNDTAIVFEYGGDARVFKRPAHLVIGYDSESMRSWYYFDKKTYLVTRSGGVGLLSDTRVNIDQGAVRFKAVGGVQLPIELRPMIDGQSNSSLVFDAIEANPEIDPTVFEVPDFKSVELRQSSDS